MIIRQLVEQLLVTVQGDSERVDVELRWAGGHKTKTQVIRPVARLDRLNYFPALCERIEQLRQQGQSARLIAQRLNAEGWRPPKRRATFTAAMVQSLWSRESAKHSSQQAELPKEQWRLRELATELDMPEVTLYSWLRRG